MVARTPMPKLARFIPSLPTLDLTGALDILLVAFVVYEALMVVRGTRAGHILIGILTMVFICPRQLGRPGGAAFPAFLHRSLYRPGHHRALSIGDPPHPGAHRTQELVRPGARLPRARSAQRNHDGGGTFLAATKSARSSSWNATSACAPSSKAACRLESRISRDMLHFHLPARPAPARWRRHHPEGPYLGGRLLPAAHHQPAPSRASWARAIAPPSASPKRPIASPSWSPRRPGAFRWPPSANCPPGSP